MNHDYQKAIQRRLNIAPKNPFTIYKIERGPSRLNLMNHESPNPLLGELPQDFTLVGSFLSLEDDVESEKDSKQKLVEAENIMGGEEYKEEEIEEIFSSHAVLLLNAHRKEMDKNVSKTLSLERMVRTECLPTYSTSPEIKTPQSPVNNLHFESMLQFRRGAKLEEGKICEKSSILSIEGIEKIEEEVKESDSESSPYSDNTEDQRLMNEFAEDQNNLPQPIIHNPSQILYQQWKLEDLDINNLNEQLYILSLLKQSINPENIINEVDYVDLPHPRRRTIFGLTLIMDMDETMLHVQMNHAYGAHYKSKDSGMGIYLRPHLFSFLGEMKKYFDLVLYSSAEDSYVQEIVDSIPNFRQYFDTILSRKNCIESQLKIKIYTKSSQVIKNRWPEDNIIVDDRISSWINDVDNLIPISPFNPCAKVTKGGQSVINMNLVYEYDDHEALSKLQNLLLEIGHKGNPRKELRKRFGLSEVVNILENSTSRHILEQNKK